MYKIRWNIPHNLWLRFVGEKIHSIDIKYPLITQNNSIQSGFWSVMCRLVSSALSFTHLQSHAFATIYPFHEIRFHKNWMAYCSIRSLADIWERKKSSREQVNFICWNKCAPYKVHVWFHWLNTVPILYMWIVTRIEYVHKMRTKNRTFQIWMYNFLEWQRK